MYGAMIGDVIGSKYEFNNIKTKDFPLISQGTDYTDDSVMTAAFAAAIMRAAGEQEKSELRFQQILTETLQKFGHRYPYPEGGYGGMFAQWLMDPCPMPYNSFGNGSAMRTSPCALAAVTLEEAKKLARLGAAITHSHREGIKGAEATSAAVFMAKTGCTKDQIRKYIEENYYRLDFTCDEIRPEYHFDGTCQGTVPQALEAFLESENFEDAIRTVISIGGDCDTSGAICGAVAWSYWNAQGNDRTTDALKEAVLPLLPKEFTDIAEKFRLFCEKRAEEYMRTGTCAAII